MPGLLGDCGGTVGIAGGAALNECLVTRAGFGTLSRGKPQALGALEHGLMLSEDAADDVVSRGRDRDVVEGGIRAEGSIDVAPWIAWTNAPWTWFAVVSSALVLVLGAARS